MCDVLAVEEAHVVHDRELVVHVVGRVVFTHPDACSVFLFQ